MHVYVTLTALLSWRSTDDIVRLLFMMHRMSFIFVFNSWVYIMTLSWGVSALS